MFTLVVTPPANTEGTDLVVSVGTAYSDIVGHTGTAASAAPLAYDTQAPSLSSASVMRQDDKVFTLDLTETVIATADAAALKDAVTFSTNGTTYNVLGAGDTAAIVDGNVEVTFANGVHSQGVSFKLAAAAVHDAAGNTNAAITTAALDTQTPNLTITNNANGIATGDVTYTFTFDEAVKNFTTDDITVVNGTKGAFTAASGAKVFTLVVTPDADSEGTDLDVSVGTIYSDNAGNVGVATLATPLAYDTLAPSLNNVSVLRQDDKVFTLEMSESVSAANAAALQAAVTFSTDGTTYNALGTGDTVAIVDGNVVVTFASGVHSQTVSFQVAAGAVHDAAGNTNAAITTAALDTQGPTLTVANNAVASSSDIAYTFTFGEAVKNFTVDDITVVNGTKGAFTAASGDTEFTLVVTPGSGTLDVAVGTAYSDLAGNSPDSPVVGASGASAQVGAGLMNYADLVANTSPVLNLNGVTGSANVLQSAEHVNLAVDPSSNVLTLQAADLLNISNTDMFNAANGWSGLPAAQPSHRLVVDGGSNDTLDINLTEWAQSTDVATFNNMSYAIYNNASLSAQLLVEQHLAMV